VTNGVYALGSREVSALNTNVQPPQVVSRGQSRVAVTNAIRIESANGPLATLIDGGDSVRCVYLDTNAVLSGFTLTNGWAVLGGGVFCEVPSAVVTNCVLRNNLASSTHCSTPRIARHWIWAKAAGPTAARSTTAR
jgi:hypothetical protein